MARPKQQPLLTADNRHEIIGFRAHKNIQTVTTMQVEEESPAITVSITQEFHVHDSVYHNSFVLTKEEFKAIGKRAGWR